MMNLLMIRDEKGVICSNCWKGISAGLFWGVLFDWCQEIRDGFGTFDEMQGRGWSSDWLMLTV